MADSTNQTIDHSQSSERRREAQREELMREIEANEVKLYSMVDPTASTRLDLEARGSRIHLSFDVLRTDGCAVDAITQRLDAIIYSREHINTFADRVLYNEELCRAIRIFEFYQRFQRWQSNELTLNNGGRPQ